MGTTADPKLTLERSKNGIADNGISDHAGSKHLGGLEMAEKASSRLGKLDATLEE